MSNNINWGKIYESTAWGSGVTDNNISWGKSYADLAGGGFTGLLDTYSGAAAAYSLRQLSSTYSGDAIVVRRSSDNTTQNIGFVNNELDTASLESFCSGTDGFVTTWYDQSGNANNAIQATASSQPKIVSSGSTILENGKAAVDFDGTDDHLLTSSTFSITSTTTLSVIKMNLASVEGYPVMIQSTNNTGYRQHLNSSYIRGRFSGTNIDDTSISPNNVHALFTIVNDGSTGSLFWNSQTQSTGSASLSADPTAVLSIAGNIAIRTTFSDGTMQELIVYSSDESTNRTGIETNINSYYSIY